MLKWADLDNAGVINQDIDLAEAVDRLADGRVNLRGIKQITLNGKHFAAASRELSFCADQFIIISREQRHFAALGANLSRKHQTEATRTAGDERYFVLERKALCSNRADNRPQRKQKNNE